MKFLDINVHLIKSYKQLLFIYKSVQRMSNVFVLLHITKYSASIESSYVYLMFDCRKYNDCYKNLNSNCGKPVA